MVGAWPALKIAMLNDPVALVSFASVTVTEKFEVCTIVGRPETTPAELRLRPADRLPLDSAQT
jgi:hypothetical protein